MKESKYQKSYRELGNNILHIDEQRTTYIKHLKSYGDLQSLVDKNTPMKVTDKKYPFMDMNGICPGCGDRIDSECNEEHHLDSDCLQALDWSDK
jgi:hypothetical protein